MWGGVGGWLEEGRRQGKDKQVCESVSESVSERVSQSERQHHSSDISKQRYYQQPVHPSLTLLTPPDKRSNPLHTLCHILDNHLETPLTASPPNVYSQVKPVEEALLLSLVLRVGLVKLVGTKGRHVGLDAASAQRNHTQGAKERGTLQPGGVVIGAC